MKKTTRRKKVQTEMTTTKKSASLTSVSENSQGLEFSQSDLFIPKIFLTQKMSEKCATGEAKYGEIRDNMNNKLLGSFQDPMEFLPLFYQRFWHVDEKGQGRSSEKWEFSKRVPVISDPSSQDYNDNWKYFSEDGRTRNIRVLEVYVLLPEEVASGIILPYLLTFRSTSFKNGKKLATQMHMRSQAGIPVYESKFKLVCKEQTNDQGTFGVMDINMSAKANDEELAACKHWQPIVRKLAQSMGEQSFLEQEGEAV